MKVLIVDDDKNILGMLTSFLSKVGWTVVAAGGSEEARGLCDDTVDVVVSDIRMDNQSGADLLLDVRRNYPCLEVILMSGYDEAREMVEQLGLQAFAYLKKPFDLAEFNRLLLAAVRERDKSLLEIRFLDRLKSEGLDLAGGEGKTGLSVNQSLERLPLPLMILNTGLEITACNLPAAALFGRTQEEMTGRCLCNLMRSGFECGLGNHESMGSDLPATGPGGLCGESGQETLFLFPDNPSRLTLRGVCRRLDPLGENAFILMIEDFTEQNEAAFRQELAVRKIVLAEIASMITHEINQPLNAISSYIQLIKYRLDSGRSMTGEELNQMCQEMLTEVGRLNGLLQSARDSSALRREQAARRPLDLRAQYYLSTALIRGLIFHRGIEIVEDFPTDLPYVTADPVRIGKVFECLLLNAINGLNVSGASGSGARGIIRVSAAGSVLDGRVGVRVEVRDNGPGIEPEIRDKIFEPFFSGDGNPSRPGVGLTIAYGILRSLDGRIQVEPVTGEGACLSFWLPESEKSE